MKDGMEYAEMLEMPVSSCDVVKKPSKKRRKRADVKEEIIAKVNDCENSENVKTDGQDEVNLDEYENVESKKSWFNPIKKNNSDKKFTFDIVKVESVAVFALVVAILLTNVFWDNSGMNVLFRKAFGTEVAEADTRTYLSFSAQAPSSDLDVSVENGVMTYSGKGSLYPVCDGKVTALVEEDGKYTITLSHSDLFKTVISGVDYVYAEKGEEVFRYVPLCYVGGGNAQVYMYNSDVLVTNYIVENGVIIWES